MKNLLAILLILLMTSACASQKKTSDQTPILTSISSAPDGSSFEKAIVINERSENAGINAEYAWLRQNYPGYKLVLQSLSFNKKIPFDILEIKTADGQSKNIYFNISNYFGKF